MSNFGGMNILLNFNDMKEMTIIPGMNNGTGTMTAKMYHGRARKIIPLQKSIPAALSETHKHGNQR